MGWIKKHKRFSVVLGIVLALCLLVSYSYSSAGSSTVVGRGVQKTFSVITRPFTAAADGISDFFTGVLTYKDIQKENEALQEEVDQLKSENQQLQMTEQEKAELEELYNAFQFEPYSTDSQAVAARITEMDMSKPYVVFTIDVGTEKGVQKDDVVTDGNGLVGRISECGNGWAKVISVYSDGNSVSFRTLRDDKVTGVVTGNGEDGMVGYVLDETDRIVKGDTLVTTGIGIYPAGIKIGEVTSVTYDDDLQQKVIEVSATADFKGMQKVVVFI